MAVFGHSQCRPGKEVERLIRTKQLAMQDDPRLSPLPMSLYIYSATFFSPLTTSETYLPTCSHLQVLPKPVLALSENSTLKKRRRKERKRDIYFRLINGFSWKECLAGSVHHFDAFALEFPASRRFKAFRWRTEIKTWSLRQGPESPSGQSGCSHGGAGGNLPCPAPPASFHA
ncbi:hypothetical protein ACLOJK_032319 [Asimina triloba]